MKNINPNGIYGFQISVEDENGKMFLTPNQKALQSLLINASLKIGDTVRIVFTHADKAKKGQNALMHYDLFVTRALNLF